MRRRPRRIWHRGRGRRRLGWFDRLRLVGGVVVVVAIVGYGIWLFTRAPAADWSIWLPIIHRGQHAALSSVPDQTMPLLFYEQ